MARLILGQRDPEPSAELRAAIARGDLAGLLWFREALGGAVEDAADRVRRMRALWPAHIPCLFAIDEEGGLIEQLDGLTERDGSRWPRLPSARALARSPDPAVAASHGREIGRRLRRLGLDVTLAPVVDLDPGPESPVLGTRCFGPDPEKVAAVALRWLEGLASAGARGAVKHYPGHGATRVDSHRSLPRIPASIDLASHRFPFEMIARAWKREPGPPPGVLTAHLLHEPGELPASLDRDCLAAIPSGLGPIWTDSLDMDALSPYGDLAARGAAALRAGSDLLVIGADVEGGLAAAPRLRESASPRLIEWIGGNRRPEIPEPWPLEAISSAADAGLRLLEEGPLAEGIWDWILPERFGPYGAVPDPPRISSGRRRIGRCLRVAPGGADLEAALQASRGPVLFGWIHRGLPDAPTRAIVERHAARIGAIAHLLDAPPECVLRNIWTMETCGFGEGETASLARRWAMADARGFAD